MKYIFEQTLASDPAPDPRLRAYLETTCALMLELERRQAKVRRFQQRTSGALVGWLLSQFMLSGGVPVELWAPGGVNGAEFADLVDVLTPKNPASGNDYHGKSADQIRLVYEGREYHQTLVQVIDSAQQFINISVFDWKTDVGGRDIAYRLMAKKLGIDGEPALVAWGIEFVLEGLHQNRKLNKDRVAERSTKLM